MDFGVEIALKRTYDHLGHKTTKKRASAFLKVKFYVKNAKNCRQETHCSMMLIFESYEHP
jgi:hypothetical protein